MPPQHRTRGNTTAPDVAGVQLLVVRYDGGTRTLTGDSGGCWDLRVGSTMREGSRTVLRAFVDRLRRQRLTATQPPVQAVELACTHRRGYGYSLVWDTRVIVSAVACPVAGPRTTPALRLTLDQLAVLKHDERTSAPRRRSRPPRNCTSGAPISVVAADVWGDRVQALLACGYYSLPGPHALGTSYVEPLPSTRRLLDQLAHEVATSVRP